MHTQKLIKLQKKDLFKDIAVQIGEYILREMTSPMGGFYSAEDADSEGEEGKFYIWDKKEIYEILGEADGELYCRTYGITDKGNFEGKNIPNLIENESFEEVSKDENLAVLRHKLYEHRDKRVHPFKDDKILTSWNGLMIAAMAFSGRVFDDNEYLEAAKKAANFILKNLRRHDGRLLARYRADSADYLGYLDDYAFLIWGLIELYQAVFDEKYINTATELADDMIKLFYDKNQKGFFLYGIDGEILITRPKELYDGAMPSGNSVAALVLLKLSRLTDRNEYEDIVNEMFQSFGGKVDRYPAGYTYFLTTYMLAVKESMEIVLVGEKEAKETSEMLRIINNEFLPHVTISLKKNGDNNYIMVDEKTTAYICRGHSCSKPMNNIDEFSKAILIG